MGELIEFLFRQPLLLIFLVIWILSGLGRLGQKAAKRVAEQQAAEQREARRVQRELSSERRGRSSSAPPPRPAAVGPTAPDESPTTDEIAAEIRRMMGMEDPPELQPVEEQLPEPVMQPLPVFREVRVVQEPSETYSPPSLPALPEVALPATSLGSRAPARRVRRRLDLSDPARVIMAMEALGPPVALR